MATLQQLPHLGVAEEDVRFVAWLVDAGAVVRPGTPIATVETLKAAFDVEAEVGGVLLRQLCAPGDRVAIAAPIAVFGEPGEVVDERLWTTPSPAPEPAAAPPSRPAPVRAATAVPVAPAARRLAEQLGVDLARVPGTGPEGLIRVADVERAHAAVAAAHPAMPLAAAAPPSPAAGIVDPDFLAAIRKDQGFAALGSDLKVMLYRRHGAQLPGHCRFGPMAVLRCERIALGADASFGPDTVIEGRELQAGPLLHFGARCRVRTTRIVCGDNAFFTDDVEVGGGGAMDPEAELLVGSHGFVGEHVHLNPCRTLRLGDEVVVSRNASVMTHSFGPSWLAGYPSRFAGVTVGDGAQIGIGAVLFPGVEVGAGAVILSGSSVVTAVPPGRLFGGVPARDLKAAAQSLTPAEVAQRAAQLVQEFARQLALRGHRVDSGGDDASRQVIVEAGDGRHVLQFAPAAPLAACPAAVETVQVAVTFAEPAFAAVPVGVTAIALVPPRIRGPLGPLASAFREFLRKRGVRLHPRTWAYPGGWL